MIRLHVLFPSCEVQLAHGLEGGHPRLHDQSLAHHQLLRGSRVAMADHANVEGGAKVLEIIFLNFVKTEFTKNKP